MAKDMNICMLMDFYGQLLTQKQFNALDMYYNEDLSLAEIAVEEEISRQGVRDAIKRGEKLLGEYEEKLGLVKRFTDISGKINEMNRIIDKMESEGGLPEVKRLKEISQLLAELL